MGADAATAITAAGSEALTAGGAVIAVAASLVVVSLIVGIVKRT